MSAPERLLRALQSGGVAERTARGAYIVWRTQSRARRPAGQISARDGDALFQAAKLKPSTDGPQLYIWNSADHTAGDTLCEAPLIPAPAAIFPLAHTRPTRRTLLERALWTAASHPAKRRRLAAACSRYTALHERAAAAGLSAMDWSGEPASGGSYTSRAPRGALGERARHDLGRLHAHIGDHEIYLLTRALLGEVSAAALARELSFKPADAVTALAGALRALADAIDSALPD